MYCHCSKACIRSKPRSSDYVKCFLRKVHMLREQAMGFRNVPAQGIAANHDMPIRWAAIEHLVHKDQDLAKCNAA